MLQRWQRIAPLFQGRPGFPADEVNHFDEVIRAEISPQQIGQTQHIWIAPRQIYHVLADTLAPSPETSLFLGLLTGARLTFKLPSSGLPQFDALARGLAERLGEPLELARQWNQASWDRADTVVVYGSDRTIAHFQSLARPWQRLVAYGHKISAARVAASDVADPILAKRAVNDILMYRQTGCLSPQIHFLPDHATALRWVQLLTRFLQENERELPDPSFEEATIIQMARDRCRLAGFPIHYGDRCRWTVVEIPPEHWFVGPGYGFVQVVVAPDLLSVLEGGRGHWSALGVSSGAWREVLAHQRALAQLGFSRFCPIGRMQEPVLSWRHDGGARLATLGRWLSIEN